MNVKKKAKQKPKIVEICEAVISNRMDTFMQLINENVDVDERDYNGLTALWYAVQNGQYEMSRILLMHGADVNMRDPFGNTPLHKAVYFNKMVPEGKIIKLLVDNGADVNVKNNYGISPIGLARQAMDFPTEILNILESKI